MTNDEIWQTQLLVNEKIRQNARVIGSEDSYSSAINRGALAFFGDKYGDMVRLIEIANGASFSFEVCGGTHVHNTGEVGSFYLLNESSIGSGVRRIEAVSGRAGEKLVWDRFKETEHLATVLQSSITDLPQRVSGILTELDELKRSKVLMDRQLSMQAAKDLLENKRNVNGITVLTGRAPANNADTLREAADWLRDQLSTGVIVLGSVTNERPIIVSMVTPDLVEKGFDARDIARDAAKEIQGGGGGKPEVAQAGGKRAEKLDEALESVIDIVREKSLLL
jgi:alanyl-tRNA synthetase